MAVYRGLRERDALRPRADGMVGLGPAAGETFAALGDAVAEALARRRWISRKPGGRVITLTPSGVRGLRATLRIEV